EPATGVEAGGAGEQDAAEAEQLLHLLVRQVETRAQPVGEGAAGVAIGDEEGAGGPGGIVGAGDPPPRPPPQAGGGGRAAPPPRPSAKRGGESGCASPRLALSLS